MRPSALPTALLALLLAGCGTTDAATRHVPASGPGDRPGHHSGQHRGTGHGWPAPVEMHSFAAPAPRGSDRATTYGLGDLDGDGRSDMVQVRTDGLVTAELTWLGHRAVRLPADPTLRLQGLSDLDGDGHAEVLVASSASGCCGGYRFGDTSSAVLTLDQDRLRPWGWADGRALRIRFGQGRGDLYAGVRCAGHALHLVEALVEGPTARLTDTTVTVAGHVARRGESVQRTIPSESARAETRSRCPGLDAQGWAG